LAAAQYIDMRCPDLPKVLFRIDYRWSAGDIELTRKYAAELRTLRMGRAMSETDRTQVSDRIGTVSLPAMRHPMRSIGSERIPLQAGSTYSPTVARHAMRFWCCRLTARQTLTSGLRFSGALEV
jgi:hypothetical protein